MEGFGFKMKGLLAHACWGLGTSVFQVPQVALPCSSGRRKHPEARSPGTAAQGGAAAEKEGMATCPLAETAPFKRSLPSNKNLAHRVQQPLTGLTPSGVGD